MGCNSYNGKLTACLMAGLSTPQGDAREVNVHFGAGAFIVTVGAAMQHCYAEAAVRGKQLQSHQPVRVVLETRTKWCAFRWRNE